MLTLNSSNIYRKSSLLGEQSCNINASDSKKNIYSSSETLSTHISDNFLQALRKQLDSKNLKSNVKYDRELNSTN